MNAAVQRLFDEVAPEGFVGNPTGRDAYGYLRVSSDEQAEEGASGLPRQLRHIGEKAFASGLRVSTEFLFVDDGFSGFDYHRPAMNALRREVEEGSARSDTIICEDIDRLARDTDIQGFFFTFFIRMHRMKLLFWKEAGSKMERMVLGLMSDQSMALAKSRMREGLLNKARSGRVTARRPAYGYRFVDQHGNPLREAGKDTYYGLDPEQAPIVRMAYEKLLHEDWGMYRIAHLLASLGVPSPRGLSHWHDTYIARMLSSPLYKGEFIANRAAYYHTGEYRADGKPKVRYRIRPEDQWIRVAIPGIVTPEEWEEAQRALRRHRDRSLKNGRKNRYLLGGVLRCVYCGYRYCGVSQAKYGKPGERIRYYMCSGVNQQRRHEVPVAERCRNTQVRADHLEQLVWGQLAKVLTDPDRLMKRLEERETGESDVLYGAQLDRLHSQLKECASEKARWDAAYARGIMEIDEYEAKINGVRTRQRELEQSRRQIEARLEQRGQLEDKKALLRARLDSLRGAELSENLPWDVKRRIIQLVVDEVGVDVLNRRFEIQGAIRTALTSQVSVGADPQVVLRSSPRPP